MVGRFFDNGYIKMARRRNRGSRKSSTAPDTSAQKSAENNAQNEIEEEVLSPEATTATGGGSAGGNGDNTPPPPGGNGSGAGDGPQEPERRLWYFRLMKWFRALFQKTPEHHIIRTEEWRAENEKYISGILSGMLLLLVSGLTVYAFTEISPLLFQGEMVKNAKDEMEILPRTINSYVEEILFGIVLGVFQFFWMVAILAPWIPNISKRLTFDIKNPNKAYVYTHIEPWQTKARVRFGRFVSFIRGWENPKFYWYSPWSWYKCYCWLFGLRVVTAIPRLQQLYVYKLKKRVKLHPRTVKENGRSIQVIEPEFIEQDLTDHVRVKAFTFPFFVSGAEINRIPTTIVGSAQAYILPYDEYRAFFNSDAWDVLFTEAIESVIPSVVRGSTGLDDVIGKVQKNLWEESSSSSDKSEVGDRVAKEIHKRLSAYTYDVWEQDGNGNPVLVKKTLAQLVSVHTMSINITNFILDISPEEEIQLRSDIYGRQKGRGLDLEGQGQAAQQQHILTVAGQAGDVGMKSLEVEAFRQAAKDNNAVGALLTGFAQWVASMNKGGKS